MVLSFNKVCNRLSLITHLTAFFSIFFFLIEYVVKSNQLHTPQSVMISLLRRTLDTLIMLCYQYQKTSQQQLLEQKIYRFIFDINMNHTASTFVVKGGKDTTT